MRYSSIKFTISRAIKDLLLVWFGTLFGAAAGILTQLMAARVLGVSDFGILSSSLALVSLVVPMCIFGTTQFWLKAYGEEGWAANRWITPSLYFLTCTTGSVVVCLSFWAIFVINDLYSQYVLLMLLPVLVSLVLIDITLTKYQLEQNYARFALLNAATPNVRLLVVLLVIVIGVQHNQLKIIAIGYMLGSITILISVLPQIRRISQNRIDLKGHGESMLATPMAANTIKRLTSESWVFGVAGFLYLAWAQGHIVVAQYALGSVDAGLYSAALVILNSVCLLPTVAFSKFLLPKVHRWAKHDFEKLRRIGNKLNVVMVVSGILIGLLLFLAAESVIYILFGTDFYNAITILQILALTLPMRFLGYNSGMMLRTKRYMQIKIVILIMAVALNLCLILLFIPRWGVFGLAWTVVLTEFFLVLAYVYFVQFHYFRLNPRSP